MYDTQAPAAAVEAPVVVAVPAAAAPAPAAQAAASEAAPAPAAAVVEQTPEQIVAAAAAEAGKTDEQRATEAKAAEEAAKATGAPEKYEAFQAPEGSSLDTGVMDKFAETARELNLPQAQAQAMIDKMAPIIASRQFEQVEQLKTEWLTSTTNDVEIGGAKLEASKVFAARAMDQFATPGLKEIFNATGFGNHPDVMRMMVKVGQAISEEKIVTGGVPATSNGIRSAADTLYPPTKPK